MVDELDFIFPFIVLFYGSVMTILTSLPVFRKIASENMNQELMDRFFAHRFLSWICCLVGALWLLQRAFIS